MADDREFRFPPTAHFIATVEDLTDMLDYGSDDIDGMDDDAGEEEPGTCHLPDAGRPLPRMTYTWWIHPKIIVATTRKTQSRINLLRYSQSADVSGAAPSHAVEKTAIPAHEKTILRTMPKTKKTPSSQPPNRTIGRMGKLALMNRPHTKTRRTVIIFHSPRRR